METTKGLGLSVILIPGSKKAAAFPKLQLTLKILHGFRKLQKLPNGCKVLRAMQDFQYPQSGNIGTITPKP